MSEKKEYSSEWCRCEFDEEELVDIALELAQKTEELEAIESEKKAVVSSFKERAERAQSEIKSCARKYKDGYEMRNIDCEVERNFSTGIVQYIRTDTGEVARTKQMTMAERQMSINDAVSYQADE